MLYDKILRINVCKLIARQLHDHGSQVPRANIGCLLLRTPGPVPFGTCICSNVETILSWTCHVYGPFEFRTSLGTSVFACLRKTRYCLKIKSIPVFDLPMYFPVKVKAEIASKLAINMTLFYRSVSNLLCLMEFEFMGVLRHMQRYFSHICYDTDVQADWRRSCTYGRAPNAIDISQGSLTWPSFTDTGPTFLYGDSRHTAPFTRLLRHARDRTYSRLKPPASSRRLCFNGLFSNSVMELYNDNGYISWQLGFNDKRSEIYHVIT